MGFLDKILREAKDANSKSKKIWRDKLNDIRRNKENIRYLNRFGRPLPQPEPEPHIES